MRGHTLYFRFLISQEEDEMGIMQPVYSERIPVDNVLYRPGKNKEVVDSTRDDGKIVAFTLYLPKTFKRDTIKNALVEVLGKECRVLDDPQPWPEQNCPPHVDWNWIVEVEYVEG